MFHCVLGKNVCLLYALCALEKYVCLSCVPCTLDENVCLSDGLFGLGVYSASLLAHCLGLLSISEAGN